MYKVYLFILLFLYTVFVVAITFFLTKYVYMRFIK